jgi:hypothetical protein
MIDGMEQHNEFPPTAGVFFDDIDRELCNGAIDMHVHLSPSIYERKDTEIAFARLAKAAGYRAAVSKSHATLNADRTQVVRTLVEFDLFGGVVLNAYVGGLNPLAVEAAIAYGGRVIWMPTMHSVQHASVFGQPVYKRLSRVAGTALQAALPQPITVLSDDGRLLEPVYEILDLIASADVVLATGHLSYSECGALIKEARSRDVQRIVVTHAEMESPDLSIEQQRELAGLGAYIEHVPIPLLPQYRRLDPQVIVAAIREVGAERCILSTDHGAANLPHPVEAMRSFLRLLRQLGIEKGELDLMVKQNPAELLNLH